MGERSVLVTGSLRGIGRAIAVRLGREGYHVVLNCRKGRDEAAEELRDEIERIGGSADILYFDISSREEAKDAIEAYLSSHQVFWGVVLNAGICSDNIFAAMSGVQWDSVIHTNLDGFFNVLSPIILPLCRKRQGRIIAISSVSGVIGNKGQVNYSASKAGIIGAVKALATEVASRNITVNAIAPGVIETDMIADLPVDEMMKAIPMKKLGKADDIAAMVSFLLSDDAGYITRQVISINGGMC